MLHSRKMYATPVWQPQVAHQKQNDSDQTLTSLRNRLKALSAHDDNDKVQDKQAPQKNQDHQPPACFKTPKEPKFLDVTTAFFSGPLSHTKSQPQKKAATTPQVPLAHGLIYPAVRKCREQQPRQQQRAQSPPHDFNVLESPVAQDLLREFLIPTSGIAATPQFLPLPLRFLRYRFLTHM